MFLLDNRYKALHVKVSRPPHDVMIVFAIPAHVLPFAFRYHPKSARDERKIVVINVRVLNARIKVCTARFLTMCLSQDFTHALPLVVARDPPHTTGCSPNCSFRTQVKNIAACRQQVNDGSEPEDMDGRR